MMKKKHVFRRLGAFALAAAMTGSLLVWPVSAEEENPGTPTETVTQGETTAPAETTEAETTAPVETTEETTAPTETTETTEATTAPTEATEATTAPTEATEETTAPTEGMGDDAPQNGADIALAEEELAQVAAVQDMIDSLPTAIAPEEQEAFQKQYAEVTAAIQALTEAQRALLDLTKYDAAANLMVTAEEPIVEEGPVEVDTEQELREALLKGGEIILTGDIEIQSALPIGATDDNEKTSIPDYPGITLDLGGHSITSNVEKAFRIYSTAKTVIQNGSIFNTASNGRCIDTRVNADVEMKKLDLKTTGGGNPQPVTIGGSKNGTKLVLDNCTIDAGGTGYAMIVFVQSNIEIKNRSVGSGYSALYMKPGSVGSQATVNDSTLYGYNIHGAGTNDFGTITLEDSVSIQVNGGTVIAEASNVADQYIIQQYANAAGFASTVVFSDSTKLELIGDNAHLLNDYIRIPEATIVIPQQYADLLGDDYKLNEDNRVVEKINSEDRLIAAVNAGGTVSLDGDITLTKPLCIPDGKDVTLDLNGHTLSDGDGLKEGDSLIIVDSGAKLTVTGEGKLRSQQYGIKLTQKDTYNENKTATLVVDSGTIEAAYFAITGNGTRHNTSITINGGQILGDAGAVYHPQKGTMTVNGGQLVGGEFGVEMRSGTLTVNGGTIQAEAEEFTINPNASGSTTVGAAVAAVPHETGNPVTVTINGGQIIGAHALHEEKLPDCTGDVTLSVTDGDFQGQVVAKDQEKFIQGGKFSEAPAENLAQEHFSFQKNADGSFSLQEDPYVEDDNGDKHYGEPGQSVSLDSLLDAHKDDSHFTLTLKADASVNQNHQLSGKLVLEVGGHQLSGSGSIRSGKAIELKDVNAQGTDISLPKGGKVEFEKGKLHILPDEAVNDEDETVGYSHPVKITYGGKTYTYFLGVDGDDEGTITIDETGKPAFSGQYFRENASASRPDFELVYITHDNVYYTGKSTSLEFVTNAPVSSLMEDYVEVDGKKIRSDDYLDITSEDTASVKLTNRYLRTLKTGVHRIEIFFKDGQSVRGVFSVRKSSIANPDNPKTGDTIGLPLAAMTLSLVGLAVLASKKKKFL